MDLVLRAGALRLCLRPAWGGRVVSLRHDTGGDVLRPVTDTEFDPEAWPRAGAYPLVPFHNRIAGARFSFGGRAAVMTAHPACLPHALHGMASRLRWAVHQATPVHADLRLVRAADRAWPWHFETRQVFDLDPNGLTLSLRLTNTDCVPMPGGLGWHPYLPRPVRVQDDARIGWPVQPDYLPSAGPVPRRALVGDTLYLAQWDQVRADLPQGLTLRFHQPQGLTHLVIHQPPGPFACIEPVSHLANALTQPDAPGMGPIAPGQSMIAQVRLSVRY